jgi:glutamate-ammonia-ligase adenylyltransferase
MGTAPSLAAVLGRRPRMMDAVLDPGFFGDLPNEEELKNLIEEEFINCQDYQDTLDRARSVGQEQAFLIGVRLLSGVINAEQAARGYSQLAETIIQELQAKVAEEMEAQHGTFQGAGVSILAMGKLGGCEMTASSDIDIILIYDFDEGQTMSDGKKPLAPSQYYARFTQRLISAITAPTAEGMLYEVDMRLRPSGRSGPVATRLESFVKYQNEQAWVWEHLALTRARPITGPKGLQQKLRSAIKQVLSRPRNRQEILKYVDEMRQKIETEKGTDNPWDIKQVRGGLIDLEFITQTIQLLSSNEHQTILDTNTRTALTKIHKAGILPDETLQQLLKAADVYNDLMQVIRLCLAENLTEDSLNSDLKIRLAESLKVKTFEEVSAKLLATEASVKSAYDNYFNKTDK